MLGNAGNDQPTRVCWEAMMPKDQKLSCQAAHESQAYLVMSTLRRPGGASRRLSVCRRMVRVNVLLDRSRQLSE